MRLPHTWVSAEDTDRHSYYVLAGDVELGPPAHVPLTLPRVQADVAVLSVLAIVEVEIARGRGPVVAAGRIEGKGSVHALTLLPREGGPTPRGIRTVCV